MKHFILLIGLLIIGMFSAYAGLFSERIENAVSELENATAKNEPLKVVSALEQLSYLYSEIDELDQEEQLCSLLIDVNKMIYGDKSAEYGHALCRYAECKIRQRDNATAKKYLKLGEPLINSNVGEMHPFYGTVMCAKATLHFVNGRMSEAYKYYQKAENIYKAAMALSMENFLKYRPNYTSVIAVKNYARFFAGLPTQNFDSDFALIESLYSDDEDHISLSDALMLKASVELKSRDLFAARYDTERVLNILRKNFGKNKIFKCINATMQLVNILQLLGDYHTADMLLDEEINDINLDPLLDQFGALGSLYMMKANGMIKSNINSDDAAYYSSLAMNLLNKEDYLKTNYLMSKYYHSVAIGRLGEFDEAAAEALECFSQISKNVNTIEDLERKYLCWLQYSNILSLENSYKAVQTLSEIETSFAKECTQYAKLRQFASLKSTLLLQQAATYSNIYFESSDEKFYRLAEKVWKDALELYSKARPYEDITKFYGSIARLYAAHGNDKEAIDYSNKYYDFWDSYLFANLAMLPAQERERYQKNLSDFFQSTLPLIIGDKTSGQEVNMLLNSSLFSKSILLLTELQIADMVKKSGDPGLEELYSIYMEAQKSIDVDRSVLKMAETAIIRNPKISKYMWNLKTVKWKDIQKVLRDDEAAVEFIQTTSMKNECSYDYLAIVIRRDKAPELIRLRDLGGINFNEDFDLRSISRLVWRPLEKKLKGINRLYFTPAGILHTLPIEYFSGSSSRSNLRLSTLIELLKKTDTKSALSGEAVLFGGIEYDAIPDTLQGRTSLDPFVTSQRSIDLNARAGVKYLPATLTEIRSIGKTLESTNLQVRLFDGAKGSEEQFKALSGRKLSVLHFATHGFYYSPEKTNKATRSLRKIFSENPAMTENERAMYRTGLLLSGANHKLTGRPLPLPWEDGILTAKEISTTDLSGTSLAVLSACQSGLGDISVEGLYGMPRALKKAGVQTIIMSLWKVDDEATSILMNHFYKSYAQCKSASDALAVAQENLKKDSRFADPYFWAAFVVLDDNQSY